MSQVLPGLKNKLILAFHNVLSMADELTAAGFSPILEAQFIREWQLLARNTYLTANLYSLKLLLNLLENLTERFPQWQALYCCYAGRLAFIKGDYVMANDYAELQLALTQTDDDYVGMVRALLDQADLHLNLLSLAKSLSVTKSKDVNWQTITEIILLNALSLSEAQNLPLQQIQVLNRLGRFFLTNLELEKSRPYLEQAANLLEDSKQWWARDENLQAELKIEEALNHHWIGVYWLTAREWAEAETALRSSLGLSYRNRNVLATIETQFRLGSLYQLLNQNDSALICFDGALATCEQLQHLPSLLKAYYYKGLALHNLGFTKESLPLARRAVELGLQTEQVVWLAEAFYNLGQIYYSRKEFNLAQICHLRVIELYPPHDRHPQWIELLLKTGDYFLNIADQPESWEEGLKCYRYILALVEINQRLEYLAPTLGKMARAFTKLKGLDGLDDASRCYRLQLRLAGDLDSTALPTRTAVAMRVEALTGLQRCAALRINHNFPVSLASTKLQTELATA